MKRQILFLIALMLLFNKIDSYSQRTSLLSDKALNDTAMVIGYNKNRKNIFTDIESNKYDSLNKIIQARYGNLIRYLPKRKE